MTGFQETVTMALETLTEGLRGYVQTQLKAAFRDDWLEVARGSFRSDRNIAELDEDVENWDAHALLTIMWDQWNAAFRRRLGLFERSLVAELRAFRNRWAHQRAFNFDDTYRLLDSVQRLLGAISAQNTTAISELKFEMLKDEFGEAINAAAQEADNRRERWIVAFVYLMCGSVFVYLLPKTFGDKAWAMSIAVAIGFLFLIWKRLKIRPVHVGPHECRSCRRIIYGTTCPYCSSASSFDSNELKGDLDSGERATEARAVPR
jgi:hypothetical protein